MRLRSLATAALLLLLTPVLSAQTRTLTLEDAIGIAVDRNRTLETARLEMDKADYQVREAVGTALPNISANGTYSRMLKKPVFFLPKKFVDPDAGDGVVPIEVGSDNSYNFGFEATQILFNAAVFTGVGTAKIYQDASRHLYRDTYNRTVSDVKKAFHGVLLAREVLSLMNASMKNAEENLRNVEIMQRQGIVSDYDYIRAQVQVDNLRPRVIETERNVVLAANGLKLLLSLPPSEEIDVKGRLEYVPVEDVMITRAEELVTEKNASLRALEDQTRVNEKIATIYRSESLPTLAAFGNYSWQAQNDLLGKISTNDFIATSQVGLSLSINLFNGLQTSSRVGQAEVDYRQSVEEYTAARDGMITMAQNIRYRLDEARRRIESQTRTVEQAEKGYRIAVTRYQTGSGTQLEVNDADLALLQARVNRVQAIYDYAVAAADLEQLLSVHQP
ncbi:MAG: TolC family protein [Bacteroidota bacterium]|jgi:outer membrane protein TolC|nr:TolC family protein [Bacteroidota bacterium]